MLIALDPTLRAPFLMARVERFASPLAAPAWRRRARRRLPGTPGLVIARAMPYIGSAAGLGQGLPDPRRQIFLSGWRSREEAEAFMAREHSRRAAQAWSALFAVTATRGSYRGVRPLVPHAADGALFGTLTLGRCRPVALPRFLAEGVRVGRLTGIAPGLISACSAGNPLGGNCTLSVWESEEHMLDFAYRERDGHARAAVHRPPILAEQLNARLRLLTVAGTPHAGLLHPERLERATANLSASSTDGGRSA